MSMLKNKPLTKLLGQFFWEKLSETTKEQVFMLFLFWGIWAPPNGSKKVPKGLRLSKMFGPRAKLKKNPLT
jgi:hypothetical protein